MYTCTAINNNGIIYIAIKPVFCAECVSPRAPSPRLFYEQTSKLIYLFGAALAHNQFNLVSLKGARRPINNKYHPQEYSQIHMRARQYLRSQKKFFLISSSFSFSVGLARATKKREFIAAAP